MNINIGISNEQRLQIAQELSKALADSYTLYLKTHNYHWNVTGPMFQTLHTMFETQYTELALAVDNVAERIRALGEKAPGTYVEFGKLTAIKEETGSLNAHQMINNLLEAHETVARTARKTLQVASEAGDDVTADLMTQRLQVHEKTAWMFRSLIED